MFNLLAVKEGVRPAWYTDGICDGIQNVTEVLDLLGLQSIDFDFSIDVDSSDQDDTDSDRDDGSSLTSNRRTTLVIFDPERTPYDRVDKVVMQMSRNERSEADIIAFGELLGYPSAGDLWGDSPRLVIQFVVEVDGMQHKLWGYVLHPENWPKVAVHAERTLTNLSEIARMYNRGLTQVSFLMRTASR